MSTNRIAADHKHGNFDNTVNKTHIEFNVLLTVLRYNLPYDKEERGETTENVFAGKDTMKTVMCDITTLNLKCIQS